MGFILSEWPGLDLRASRLPPLSAGGHFAGRGEHVDPGATRQVLSPVPRAIFGSTRFYLI